MNTCVCVTHTETRGKRRKKWWKHYNTHRQFQTHHKWFQYYIQLFNSKVKRHSLPPHSRPRRMWQAWQTLRNDTSQAWLQHLCLLILISSSKVMNIFRPLSPSTLQADLGHVASSWPKYFIRQCSTPTYRLNVVRVTFQETFWIHYPNWQMICKHQKAVCQQLYL